MHRYGDRADEIGRRRKEIEKLSNDQAEDRIRHIDGWSRFANDR
jgi:hypothetical protein